MLLAIALAAFVSLGLPDAVLGVAWPSIRRTFSLPADQLGTLLASAMAGYLVSSFSSGAVVARLGVGWLLFWSSALMVVNSLAYALAPTWGVMVAASVLAGLGAGAIDAGINAFAAARFSPRRVSWLHASYGVGATLGPLLMTVVARLPGDGPERLERVSWLGACRVVWIALGRPDDPLPVDDEAGRDRQRPGGLAIELLEIEGEGTVQRAQVVRHGEPEAEPGGDLVAAVREDRKCEVAALDQLPAMLGELRRDGDQLRSERRDLRQDSL
jgi:hypothetical protein